MIHLNAKGLLTPWMIYSDPSLLVKKMILLRMTMGLVILMKSTGMGRGLTTSSMTMKVQSRRGERPNNPGSLVYMSRSNPVALHGEGTDVIYVGASARCAVGIWAYT